MASFYADPTNKKPLDKQLVLSPKELDLFRRQTRIQDEDALIQHILEVQKKAYDIYGYQTIRSFGFAREQLSRFSTYQDALKLLNERPDAIFLDLACCAGADLRKAVSDGWPIQNVIASDLEQGFWNCGHELFKTTPESYPAAFIAGDIFDSGLLSPCGPSTEAPSSPRPIDLNSLTSLTSLRGHISVIYVAALFHLFDETRQYELAQRVASLLSPLPGSVIFGSHMGLPQKGMARRVEDEPELFCHSPQTWGDLWDGQVFEKGAVEVKTTLWQVLMNEEGKAPYPLNVMDWSITRK